MNSPTITAHFTVTLDRPHWKEANILPPFPSFSVHKDDASVGPRWKKWLKRFQLYLAAHDVKDPTQASAVLILRW